MRKPAVIDIEDLKKIHPVFSKKIGIKLADFLMKFTGLNKVNWVYKRSIEHEGVEFTRRLLKDVEVTYSIENEEILNNLPEGAFITVSNHVYGALDGIMAIDIIARKRPDYKMMVNWMLNMIKTMAPNFIGVNPYDGAKDKHSSVGGVKQCIAHLKEGHPLGFFPAGAVSKYNNRLEIVDREWQPSVMRLIRKAKVPVIPVFFHGYNSTFYNLIGLVSWKLRTLRLCHEVFNKKGRTFKITFGEIISVEEQAKYKDLKEYTQFLRDKTYGLQKGKD
ncbi:MAG: lysophospholipid acyltransferase family protein [Candidatus Azobacteroides sp.]|nr:lysophospholipid acyltransferase family protein [Candidatus Azobacteroides sp.]